MNSTEIYFQQNCIYNKKQAQRCMAILPLALQCESSGTDYHDALLQSWNYYKVSVFAFITCDGNSYSVNKPLFIALIG